MADEGLLLSDILGTCPNFSFFQELINIRQIESSASNLLKYDFYKINKIIKDITLYLADLYEILFNISDLKHLNQDLNWVLEGKDDINNVIKNIESIDSIVSQLLVIIENKTQENEYLSSNYMNLLKDFERINDLALGVKNNLYPIKKVLHIAIQFHELEKMVINSINDEIDSCLGQIFKIYEVKMDSPRRTSPDFQLESILHKIQPTILSTNSKSFKLPTFNPLDANIYEQYMELQSRVTPIQASIQFIPPRIEEFKFIAQNYSKSIKKIEAKFNELLTKYEYLLKELDSLKVEIIDSRWNEIFHFLTKEMSKSFVKMSAELAKNNGILLHSLIGDYKLIRIGMNILEKSLKDELISERGLIQDSQELLNQWEEMNMNLRLNDLDASSEENEKAKGPIYENGLKKLNMTPSSSKSNRYSLNIEMLSSEKQLETPTKLKRHTKGEMFMNRLSIQPILVENTPISIGKEKSYKEGPQLSAPKNIKDKLLQELDESEEYKETEEDKPDSSVPSSKDTSSSIYNITAKIQELRISSAQKLSPSKMIEGRLSSSERITTPRRLSNKQSPNKSPRPSKLPVLSYSPNATKHITRLPQVSKKSSMIPVLSNRSRILENSNRTNSNFAKPSKRASMMHPPTSSKIEIRTRSQSAMNNFSYMKYPVSSPSTASDGSNSSRSGSSIGSRYESGYESGSQQWR